MRPGRRLWVHISTLFSAILKRVLSTNLDQDISKMRMFLEKSCKIAAASGLRPRTHVGLQRLGALAPDSRVVTPALLEGVVRETQKARPPPHIEMLFQVFKLNFS